MAEARKRARGPGKKKAGGRSSKPARTPAASRKETRPAEPETTSPERILELPPSGLAEEVLKDDAPSGVETGPEAAGDTRRIELPSSGLAADVLSQPETARVSVEPAPAASDAGEAPAQAASPGVAETGAQSLSFFAAPAREERAAAEDTEHLATFLLDKEEYGVDVRQVQEIRRVGEITSVPRAPAFVRGVINLRGRILPVLDLKRKLGLGEVALERSARIVVVRTEGRMLGLLVDGASQVLKVPVSRVEPPPEEVVERGGDYIRAVAKLDDRLIILIDLARVLAQELREAPSSGA